MFRKGLTACLGIALTLVPLALSGAERGPCPTAKAMLRDGELTGMYGPFPNNRDADSCGRSFHRQPSGEVVGYSTGGRYLILAFRSGVTPYRTIHFDGKDYEKQD
jgi:hypothetical protein